MVDRGFSSADNLDYLTRAGGHFIAGEQRRSRAPLVEQALSRQGRYQSVRDNLRVKEVRLDGAPGRRWVICHNPDEAEREKANRDAALVIDRSKVAAKERLDGKYLLSTSDPDLSAEDIALGYKNLLEAERSFRDMKSTLELRPVFDRLEPRIRAHVLLCWLALLLIRVAERRTGPTRRCLAIELGRVPAVTLTGSVGSVVHVTPLSTVQAGILRGQVPAPATVTALHPA